MYFIHQWCNSNEKIKDPTAPSLVKTSLYIMYANNNIINLMIR